MAVGPVIRALVMERPSEVNSLLIDLHGTVIANVRMQLGDEVALDSRRYKLSTTGGGYNVYHELSGAPDTGENNESGKPNSSAAVGRNR